MTSTEPPAGDRGSVKSERTTERVVARECVGCGQPVVYAGRGRRGRYCTAACRQRAWALRTAQRQLDAGADPRPSVVREVVERTTERVVERVTVRAVPVAGIVAPATAAAAPANARGWLDLLRQLGAQLADERSPVAREHWHHPRLYGELMRVVTALGHAHPGGLDRLSGR